MCVCVCVCVCVCTRYMHIYTLFLPTTKHLSSHWYLFMLIQHHRVCSSFFPGSPPALVPSLIVDTLLTLGSVARARLPFHGEPTYPLEALAPCAVLTQHTQLHPDWTPSCCMALPHVPMPSLPSLGSDTWLWPMQLLVPPAGQTAASLCPLNSFGTDKFPKRGEQRESSLSF